MNKLAQTIDSLITEGYGDNTVSIQASIDMIKSPGATLWVSVHASVEGNPIWVKAVQRDVVTQLKKMLDYNASDEIKIQASMVRGDVYLG